MNEWSSESPDQPTPNRSVFGSSRDDSLPVSPPPAPLVTSDPPPPIRNDVDATAPFEPVIVTPPNDPPAADPDADELPSRRPRRVGMIVLGGLAAVGLAGGGAYVGATLADDDSAPVAVTEPVSVATDADGDEVTQEATSAPEPVAQAPAAAEPIPDVPGPVTEAGAEPVADVAEAVAPSVVRIDTGTGTGSGIIYDASGLIVTNAHVVGDAEDVTVRLADGRRTDGTVLGSDPKVDIAVVQIDASIGFEVATFAPSSSVEVGQLAVAIGSPFGLDQTVTSGIISAVNRAITNQAIDGTPTVVEMLQTDAPINPGNSGGALADREGRIVGINTSIRTDGTTNGNLGVGFAVPSDTAMLIAGRIVAGEPLDSGFLGVSGQDPTAGDPGALVTEVVPGSPAAAAGLEVGDLIIGIDGDTVPGMTELAARIRLQAPDTVVVLDVVRNGETIVVNVTLGTRDA